MKLTLEQRIARAERVLKMFVRRGRKYRSEFREDIAILIHTQMRDNREWRARKREIDERINILINSQIATDEQIQALTASQAKTDEALDRLISSQAKTDEALRRFIDSLRKGRNGNASD